MQRNALRTQGPAIVRFLKKHGVRHPWYYSDVFHYANIDGKLYPFISALRSRRTVIVGPAHLRVLNIRTIAYSHFVEVPLKNCFLETDTVEKEILRWGSGKRDVVYAFSASMAANVMIHELFPRLGADNWLLDLGAIWDVYAGVKSRWCFADRDWEPIIRRNLVRRNLGEGRVGPRISL
jgi:hypothetical protein